MAVPIFSPLIFHQQVYYLDNIDHPGLLVDRTSTPRLTFYDNALIDRLTDADTTITIEDALTFGVQPVSHLCYLICSILIHFYNHINNNPVSFTSTLSLTVQAMEYHLLLCCRCLWCSLPKHKRSYGRNTQFRHPTPPGFVI
jgi:hypothetical protein